MANPYSFYGSVAECAAAQSDRCAACLAGGPCPAITDAASGQAECMQLTDHAGRGEFLICINLALAIDAVAGCAASRAPSCPRDTGASESLSTLEANAEFLDDPACAAPLDACLAALYGSSSGNFPGPGSSGPASPPRSTSIDCGDSFSGDPNCDDAPDCELDGPSCDAPYDGTCEDSNEQSGCSDSGSGDGADAGGDSCSGDDSGGDSCSSGDGGGGDCSGGDSGGCSGGDSGGDCGGGGGDCSGGGGDCGGGGGGDCNVAGPRGRPGAGLLVAIAWALLPIPFATIVRRRAERRRARAEYDAEPPDADGADANGADANGANANGADAKPGGAP
ncbi:MAG TPA: hypothetical protein VHT91_12810 [Kofleriaceae bacterium]|jgi:hypothetical protein|nr:hypothetical protein [Kofleriaceae bacterium]